MSSPYLPPLFVLFAICAALIYNQKRLDELRDFIKAQVASFRIERGVEFRESGDRIVQAIRGSEQHIVEATAERERDVERPES